jgi:hypothetical protein
MTTPLFHPRQTLGRTGFMATLLEIGDLTDRQLPLAQLVATIQRALDTCLNLVSSAHDEQEMNTYDGTKSPYHAEQRRHDTGSRTRHIASECPRTDRGCSR